MIQITGTRKSPGEKIVKDIKRATRKQYSSEEKIRIVLDGLRGEDSIAELCRREGTSQGICYNVRKTSWKRARSGWQAIQLSNCALCKSRFLQSVNLVTLTFSEAGVGSHSWSFTLDAWASLPHAS